MNFRYCAPAQVAAVIISAKESPSPRRYAGVAAVDLAALWGSDFLSPASYYLSDAYRTAQRFSEGQALSRAAATPDSSPVTLIRDMARRQDLTIVGIRRGIASVAYGSEFDVLGVAHRPSVRRLLEAESALGERLPM